MIRLDQLFRLRPDDAAKAKVRFLVQDPAGEDPLETYLADPSRVEYGWTLHYNVKKPFRIGDLVFAFCRKHGDWLFVGAKEIAGMGKDSYLGRNLDEFDCWKGRLVASYWNRSQNLVRRWNGIAASIEVRSLLEEPYSGDRFPGYDKVESLSFGRLEQIVKRRLPDWVAALSNAKAVYLVTDVRSNMLYVGSATSSNGMLLKRWADYVDSGHGGNAEFRKLSFDYIKANFRYSILEHFTCTTPDCEILQREQVWKQRLRTIQSGYNRN